MFGQAIRAADLLFQIKLLKDKVAAFESGEKYVRMQEEHRRIVADRDREIRRLKAELAAAHAETASVRKKWSETCEDVLKEKEAAVAAMGEEAEQAKAAMYAAQRERDEARNLLHAKNLELYGVKTELEDMKGKIKELTARVNRDYTNSSKSSSQSPDHKTIPNGREKTGRKPGGQPGHPHHGRKRQEPTRTVLIPAPDEYATGSRYRPTGEFVRKQLVILHMDAEVVEYVTPEFVCKATGKTAHAKFPDGVRDDVNYDGTVKAAAYMLNNVCYVSIGGTRRFLKEISKGKISLSDGMVCGLSREFSEKTKEERDRIFLELLASPSINADFTFGRVEGKLGAVMISASGGRVLYQGREKKGHEGVKGSPVELYGGTVVSDHESTFHNYGTQHQECLVHVERYLRPGIENEPSVKWSGEMLEWVREAIHYRNSIAEGENADEAKVADLERRYMEILAKAKDEYEYEPPDKYFKDGFNLYRRMSDDMSDYVLFLHDMTVPPTNNAAENAARKYKRKNAQVTCFRSVDGHNHFCNGLTVTENMKADGENLFEGVTARFNQTQGAK